VAVLLGGERSIALLLVLPEQSLRRRCVDVVINEQIRVKVSQTKVEPPWQKTDESVSERQKASENQRRAEQQAR